MACLVLVSSGEPIPGITSRNLAHKHTIRPRLGRRLEYSTVDINFGDEGKKRFYTRYICNLVCISFLFLPSPGIGFDDVVK